MQRYFTYSWGRNEVDGYVSAGDEGQPVQRAWGDKFAARGITDGDIIYFVSIRDGEMYLLARGQVKGEILRVPSSGEGGQEIRLKNSTPMRLRRKVPSKVAHGLAFAPGRPHFFFRKNGHLDPQTLRAIRQLTPQSAAMLDQLL